MSSLTGWYRRQYLRSEIIRHNQNVFVALLFFLLAQLLVCAFDQPFWALGLDFPGQIIAMVAIWLVIWAVQDIFFTTGYGLERFYYDHLKAPTDILNKHMSIGFTVPVMAMIKNTPADAKQGTLIACAFIITGLLNAIIVYSFAYYFQLFITKINFRRNVKISDIETTQDPQPAITTMTPRRTPSRRIEYPDERSRKCISDVSTLDNQAGCVDDVTTPNQDPTSPSPRIQPLQTQPEKRKSPPRHGIVTPKLELSTPKRIWTWVERHIFITLSAVCFFLVGFPFAYDTSSSATDVPVDTAFLFFIWLSFSAVQVSTKKWPRMNNYPKWRAGLATMLNPVLWTSVFLIIYAVTKASIRHTTRVAVVNNFSTGESISKWICRHKDAKTTTPSSSHSHGPIPFGAGDIATSVLNAGIVSWGFKLFEYRRQVWSYGGSTVLVVCAAASICNIVLWPQLAHAIGVRPAARDLSFASRSVTIALGGPVVTTLGGDAGLNAVGVVVNGLLFQLVAGARGEVWARNLGRWWERLSVDELHKMNNMPRGVTQEKQECASSNPRPSAPNAPLEPRYSSDATHTNDRINDTGAGRDMTSGTMTRDADLCSEEENDDDVRTVAAGVAIGINAAAMGTATLYELKNDAAPFSALAMTTFGVFTVFYTMIPQLNLWLVERVSRQ